MNKKIFYAILIAVSLAVGAVGAAVLPTLLVPSTGTVAEIVSPLTSNPTSIDFGTVNQGEFVTKEITLTNTGSNDPITNLILSTDNWSNTTASIGLTLTWNYTTTTMGLNVPYGIAFTLAASPTATLGTFSFDIVITPETAS